MAVPIVHLAPSRLQLGFLAPTEWGRGAERGGKAVASEAERG